VKLFTVVRETVHVKFTVVRENFPKSPGLDGLSYEFYNTVFHFVGPGLLEALNCMLAEGQLTPSLCNSVIRLLPKVAGIPTAAQLCPIILLNTDYKLLIIARIIPPPPILPVVLCAGPQYF
jgi:hypothetical protein